MQASPQTSTARARLFSRLQRRNRIIGFLRFGVPGAGIALAGVLVFQIVLANLAENFGVDGIRLERDQLVFDAPRYAGVMADGTVYEVVAEAARASVTNTDIINLDVATIVTEQPDGYSMTADAKNAQMNLVDQQVFVPGLMLTSDSNRVKGQLNDSIIDWPTQVLTARGPVRFDFEDGAAIEAQSLVYKANRKVWDFRDVRYTVPGDGGSADE
jgi:lipopolysaccharide export system protein LptC